MLYRAENDNSREILYKFFLNQFYSLLDKFFIFNYLVNKAFLEEGKDNIRLINYFFKQPFL